MTERVPTADGTARPELSPVHDFAAKLTQPSTIDHLRRYVKLQAARRSGRPASDAAGAAALPAIGPISINLDLTTACNYRCDHCVDLDILNQRTRHDDDELLASLTTMAERGLRSVILIGGGEPTLHASFERVVRHLKDLGMQVGLVTNGSRIARVLQVADALDERDFVRLSLDAGTDATFQAMHRPRQAVTLEEICAGVPPLKDANPRLLVGFSFIIVWQGCEANDAAIHENLDEMVPAALLARDHRFDYISFKPFLVRGDGPTSDGGADGRSSGPEVVELVRSESRVAEVLATIRRNLNEARALVGDGLRIIESTNLRVLQNGTYVDYLNQPRTCHMTFFRQVLSPLGAFHCPVYRNVDAGRLGSRSAYASATAADATAAETLRVIDSFDASTECQSVTCLYNDANWFIEGLIEDPASVGGLVPGDERADFFL